MNSIKIVMLGDSLDHQGGIAAVENLILKYRPPTCDIHHISTHERGTLIHRIDVFGHGVREFIIHLFTKKVDLVYIQCADGGSVLRKSILATISLLFRRPILMHVHAELNVTYSYLPYLAQIALKSVFGKCNRFILLSHGMQNFYINTLNINKKKLTILQNPIELPVTAESPLSLEEKDRELVILFLGRISKPKGVFDLIRAFSHLPHQPQRHLKLILAGDGDIELGKALTEELNLSDQVTFLGWVDANHRNSLLAAADIFVLPSYTEQLPIVILEAMAWGVPIISCPVGGIPDILVHGENGLLVPPGDIQALTKAIESLIDDNSLRIALSQAARKNAQKFDVKLYINQLEGIFNECF